MSQETKRLTWKIVNGLVNERGLIPPYTGSVADYEDGWLACIVEELEKASKRVGDLKNELLGVCLEIEKQESPAGGVDVCDSFAGQRESSLDSAELDGSEWDECDE